MKSKVLSAVFAFVIIAGLIASPVETEASVTSGVFSVLGSELSRTVKASVASKELPVLSVGEVQEAATSETETEVSTEFTEILSEISETEQGTKETELPQTARAGVVGTLDLALSEENAEDTAEEASEEIEEVIEEAEEAIEPIGGYTNIGICNISEGNLNIRTAPGEDAELAGKLPKEAACEILAEENGWSQITSGEVEGYVKSEYLLTGEAARAKAKELLTLTATVTADVLNVREEPNTACEITDQMANGEEIPVLEEMGEWLKVDVDGEERYINAEFVSVGEQLRDALTLTEARYGEGVSDVRIAVVEYATQFVGNPYVWGGTSLTNGADCSGFVLSIMANYGVYLPHSSAAQANCGTRISASELQPGDLVFYGSGSRIGHVAIYIGNGQICHASNKRTGITISNMYYRSPICCTRVL